MKKLMVIGITSLVPFILSASAFYFWQHIQRSVPARDTVGKYGPSPKKSAKHASVPLAGASHEDSARRPEVTPAHDPGTEEIDRMTSEQRSRLASVREGEEQLAAREKMIELIQEDIRSERTALEELRSQIKSELEALNEAVEGAEKQGGSLDRKGAE
jgi:hypothetical protein